MPTVLTHPAVPLAIGLGLGRPGDSEVVWVWLAMAVVFVMLVAGRRSFRGGAGIAPRS